MNLRTTRYWRAQKGSDKRAITLFPETMPTYRCSLTLIHDPKQKIIMGEDDNTWYVDGFYCVFSNISRAVYQNVDIR